MIHFLSWYLVISALGWLALPLAFRLFGGLPDRGYTFARPLGLLTSGFVFWLSCSLGLLFNDAGGILASAAVVTIFGLAWLGKNGLGELGGWLRREVRLVLAVEVFFLAAFALWAVVRAYNPEIAGTEKPMEFMFLNSILRSPVFPPHDAWLSDHAISYYYFGYVLIALLTRLTGVPSAVGFNLGIAALFALTGLGALGVVMNLIALARQRAAPLLASFWPALLAPVMVLAAGNYYGALELAHHNGLLAQAKVPAVWYDFGQPPADRPPGSLDDFNPPPGIRAGTINLWEWLDLKRLESPPGAQTGKWRWDLPYWFFAARVVHDRNLVGAETEAIDENPAFSFLLGDMHPHVLALPFVILAAGLALEWMAWAFNHAGLSFSRRQAGDWLPRLALTAVVVGSLLFLNTWDFPIYWFLTVLALAVGTGARRGWEGLLEHLGRVAAFAGLLAALSLVFYLPYFFTFQSQAGGILPNAFYPTRFQQTVVMFGPLMGWVAVFVVWAVRRWRLEYDLRAALWTGGGLTVLLVLVMSAMTAAAALAPGLAQQITPVVAPLSIQEAVSLLVQRRLIDSLATLFPAFMLGASAGLVVGLLKAASAHRVKGESFAEAEERAAALTSGVVEVQNTHSSPATILPSNAMPETLPALMALVMILTGALLLLGPEYVYLRDLFNTRMNTLFKFYFQVWALWGMAAAFAAWYLGHEAAARGGWGLRFAWLLGALAVLPGLVYLPGALLSKTNAFAGPPTLDGMAYFARDYPDDWAAIRWLDENVSGRPVILEGSRGSYWMEGRSSRISMATGLPTVMGWPWHEQQWRGRYYEQVAVRTEHIQQAYAVREWAATQAILERYRVEYIVVSPLEMVWYSVYQAKFERYLEAVFSSGAVTIYRYSPGGPEH